MTERKSFLSRAFEAALQARQRRANAEAAQYCAVLANSDTSLD